MELIKVLRLLSDKTRLSILRRLREGEKSVSRIVESLKLSQPTVSHHLKKMEEAGLVVKRKYKRWVFYQANTEYLKNFIKEFGIELDL